jgi:uncharacterized protein YdaU (DUF1376 family)
MNYFKFHIGDYRQATMHLTNEEDLAYRRLLEMYYDTEQPIPTDIPWVSRRLRLDSKSIESVLNDFFTLTPEGWLNHRADQEIAEYHAWIEKQKANGGKGGRPKKTQEKPTANPVLTQKNHKPLTTNQKPELINPPNPPGGKSDEEHPSFVALWSAYPKRPGSSRASTLKAFMARIREGVAPETMLFGVRAYAAYCQKAVSDPKHIKQPETFLGPGQHYLSDWSYTPPEPGISYARHQDVDNSAVAKTRRASEQWRREQEGIGGGDESSGILEGEFVRHSL